MFIIISCFAYIPYLVEKYIAMKIPCWLYLIVNNQCPHWQVGNKAVKAKENRQLSEKEK